MSEEKTVANPLVSVVIPAYNCERYIEESVRSALRQTLEDLEIIIIDDSSTDDTYEILLRLAAGDNRVRILQNEKNLGVADTRNRAFDEARGQYIAFLDGDDIWLPNKLEMQLALMEEVNCDFCCTSYSFINENGQAIGKPYLVSRAISLEKLIGENMIGCSTVLCKAEILKQYRMRSEYAHEDYALWLELLRDGYLADGINEPLMKYRVLKGSRSKNKIRSAVNRWKIYSNLLNMGFLKSCKAFLHYVISGIMKHKSLN